MYPGQACLVGSAAGHVRVAGQHLQGGLVSVDPRIVAGCPCLEILDLFLYVGRGWADEKGEVPRSSATEAATAKTTSSAAGTSGACGRRHARTAAAGRASGAIASNYARVQGEEWRQERWYSMRRRAAGAAATPGAPPSRGGRSPRFSEPLGRPPTLAERVSIASASGT